jgi:hypothetical protein
MLAAGWDATRNQRSRIERERDETEAPEQQVGRHSERDNVSGLQR